MLDSSAIDLAFKFTLGQSSHLSICTHVLSIYIASCHDLWSLSWSCSFICQALTVIKVICFCSHLTCTFLAWFSLSGSVRLIDCTGHGHEVAGLKVGNGDMLLCTVFFVLLLYEVVVVELVLEVGTDEFVTVIIAIIISSWWRKCLMVVLAFGWPNLAEGVGWKYLSLIWLSLRRLWHERWIVHLLLNRAQLRWVIGIWWEIWMHIALLPLHRVHSPVAIFGSWFPPRACETFLVVEIGGCIVVDWDLVRIVRSWW